MHTITNAQTMIQKIEPALSAIGYHCGLTGSVLFKGESTKDTDVIIYPHNPKETKSAEEILFVLTPLGFSGNGSTDAEYTNREVFIREYEGRRVDLFFL